ncbi:aminopeptidase N-like [Nylanderia fulva]|uniref:aminopeptidase N-like n=1 Tax=Nylanderia fulva TaxID=613905 RepID=UPI0010FAF42A|nr:aminopeptidase N-like [Nylanderia fulva]
MFLKLSLNILLYIFVMTMVSCLNDHKLIGIASLHYKLKISLMPGYVSHGESNITVYIRGPTQNMTLLTSKRINVTTVHLIADDNKKVYKPKLLYNHNKNNVVLNFIELVYPNISLEFGYYTLSVKFLNFDTEELSQTWYTNEKENKKFIATLFQPAKNRPLFPCFNTSELVTFNISVEHDRRYTVLSNMPIKNQSISNDVMLTHFHTYPATYIYDVALILMSPNMTTSNPIEYDTYLAPSSKIKINTWSRSHLVPHMKFAQRVLGKITKYLEDNWKIFRRVPKVDYIVIPNFEGNIEQTWGLLLYNETYITYDEKLYSAAYKGIAMRLITRDIIYQWFGSLFYPSFWLNHWWLNEGFIKFIEEYIIDKVFPSSRIMDLSIIQDLHEYRYMDIHFPREIFGRYIKNTFKINSLSVRQHIRGPIIWHMLSSVIPDNMFWENINTFLDTKLIYFNSRLPDNLWDIMQTTIDKLAIENKIDIKKMMNVWTEQKYCPVLNVIRDYNGAYVNISIDKKQFLNQSTFFIPITYTTEMNIDFNTKLPTIEHYLTESNPELKIPIKNEDQWVIVNKQQIGYYRVNYDAENWQRIAHYLNSENYIKIHVLNRAQIIDDAFHLAMEKKLNFSIFWDIVGYLPKREIDYIAWYPMIKAFEYLSNFFAIINVYDKDFLWTVLQRAAFTIKNMLDHEREYIYPYLYRYEGIPQQLRPVEDDFEKYLKLDLTKWGCVNNNSLCIAMAKKKLELYLKNQTLNKILPGWEEWTFCNGLKTANVSMWSAVYSMASNIYKETSNYKMLKYLGCSENPNIIVLYLWTVLPEFKQDLLKENDYKMLTQKDKDKINCLITNMFLSTLARQAKNTLVLRDILPSYDINYRRSPVSMATTLNVLINNVYTGKLLTEIRVFAKEHMPSIEYEYVENKLKIRSYKLTDQLKFFNDLFE